MVTTTDKKFGSGILETFKDFAENTSFHGVKLTVKDTISTFEKIFWVLVIVSCAVGAGYMTVLFWRRYTSNPTRTSILTDYAPNTAVPFPAITICNINRILASQVDDFVKELKMHSNQVEIVRRAFPQLLAFTDPDFTTYNITELRILQDVLSNNDYNDVGAIMRKVSQPCDRMLVKCAWQFKVASCKQIFINTYTSDGPCCSFNYLGSNMDNQPVHSPFNGYNSGLKLLLNPDSQQVQYSSLHSTGLKVIIHSPFDYPGSGSINKIVSTGRQTYLQISGSKIISSSEIKLLSIEQRQCAYSSEVSLEYFREYSDKNCLTECEERHFIRECGCAPFFYSFTKRNVCNITNIPCLNGATETTDYTKSCNCPSQCEEFFYDVLSSSAAITVTSTYSTNSFISEENISSESIMLYVYFSGRRQRILFKDVITSTLYLLSSFGGVYCLLLGCSFISIIEIVYYCTFRFPVNLKLVGKTDKTNAPQKKEVGDQLQFGHKLWPYERNVFLN